MGDDSSDDEPVFSSPDTSDDGSIDEDFFKFRARKFEKLLQPSSPSPARGRRRQHIDVVKQKLELLERKQDSTRKRTKQMAEANDPSSSDEEDFKPKGSAKNLGGGDKNDVIEIFDEGATAGRSLTKTKGPEIEGLESDSDDDNHPAETMLLTLKGVSKEVLDTLRQSQLAANKLREAQQYHAEDIRVEQKFSPLKLPLQSQQVRTTLPNILAKNRFELGKVVRLECRCQIKINGKPQITQQKRVSIHEHQPLSDLLEKVKMKFSLASDSLVAMNFDGLNLDLRKTPATFDMESDDLVDITVNVVNAPKEVGRRITLKLRSKVGVKIEETVMSLGMNQPFQILMDQYNTKHKVAGKKCSLRFDGETLSLNLTPARYDMENGELIDVVR